MGKNIGRVLTGGVSGRSKTLDKVIDPMGFFQDAEQFTPEVANKAYFDVTAEAKKAQEAYQPLLAASQAQQAAVAPNQLQALQQMGLAATGRGPSLAEAQMKAAQDRNLAQQLAVIQAGRGGNAALSQRALMQNMGQSGQNLAQQAAIARLQERDAFLNQANVASQNLRTDVTGKLNLDVMPKQALQQWEMARVGAQNAATQGNLAAQQAQKGAVLGAAGSIVGSFFGGPAGGAIGGQAGKLVPGQQAATGSMPNYMTAKDGGYMKDLIKKHNKSNKRPNYEDGGEVEGPGTGTSDEVPINVSNGEFIVKAKIVNQPGTLDFLKKLNAGKIDSDKLAQILSKEGSKKNKSKDDEEDEKED